MARESRYIHTITISTVADIADGYGGIKRGEPVPVVVDYPCLCYEPRMSAASLIRAEYGLSEGSKVLHVTGGYITGISTGQVFIFNGYEYIVRGVRTITGARDTASLLLVAECRK